MFVIAMCKLNRLTDISLLKVIVVSFYGIYFTLLLLTFSDLIFKYFSPLLGAQKQKI